MAEQTLFWEALESYFNDHWDQFMSKQDHGVWVRLYVRAWDHTYRVTHKVGRPDREEVMYEGPDRAMVEKWLSGAAV